MELLKRARSGDIDGVKTLIQQGVDVNAMKYNIQTALYWACEKGRTEVAHYLLENGASVNLGHDKPLIAAVRGSHYDCVKLLLEYHADARCTNSRRETPMSVALLQEHPNDTKLILLLLQYDAILTASLSDDMSVQLLKHAKAEHANAIQKLIDGNFINLSVESTFLAAFEFAFQRCSVELGEKILWSDYYLQIEQLYPEAVCYSARNNWPNILSKLIEKGADVNALTKRRRTPRRIDCMIGRKCLRSNKCADPNYIYDDGRPAIHIAVRFGNLSIAEMLLSAGANINAMDSEGSTPLSSACARGETQVVKLLLSRGASPNVETIGVYTGYPIHRACAGLRYDVVKLLLEYNADVNVRDKSGDTALHCAVSSHSYCAAASHSYRDSDETSDVVQLLLDAGADVNAESERGKTPFYIACSEGLTSVAKKMLESGAKIDGNSSKKVPLNAACRNKHLGLSVIELLLTNGANPNLQESSSSRYRCPLLLNIVTSALQTKYTSLFQVAVLAGYVPSDEELQQLRWAAARDDKEGHQIQQLVNWLNEDRQQVPSLLRQCRVVIRRQLSVALHFQSILPAIEQLGLPNVGGFPLPKNNDVTLYLKYDGPLTEVDIISVKQGAENQ